MVDKEEPFYAGQTRILEMVASGAPLSDTLNDIVHLLEAHADGMICSILLLSPDGKHVQTGAAPSLPRAYVNAVDGMSIGPRHGSCGTAMFLKKPVVVTDVMNDPLWADYTELAATCGFRACWATPILSPNGDVLGSFAMYGRESRGPSAEEMHLIEVATHITGIAIGRKRAEEAQKQSELQLQVQRDELAHLNRAALMGEMTASIAHELNQPLTALTNNAAAALRFLDRGALDPVMLREICQDIIADSFRAREVIRGVRALARKDRSIRSILDLNALITDTLRLVSKDINLRESMVWTELDDDLPQIEGTPVQIQQVLLNLIMNALDALEPLPPSARRMIISTGSDHGDAVEVRVRDFGTGLPKDGAEKVFDHFFSTKPDGMGMGLTIVRSIIETHGGTITAKNAPGGGALFFFRLPAVSKNNNTGGEESIADSIFDEPTAATRRLVPSRAVAHGV